MPPICYSFLVHAWKYLNWVCERINSGSVMQQPNKPSLPSNSATLLSVVDECLRANFSNYSAWHYFCTQHGEAKEKALEQSRNAIFTSPFDQSAWFVYNSILKTSSQIDIKIEMDLLEELRKEEPNCYYLLLTLIDTSKLLDHGDNQTRVEYRKSLLSTLKRIDPTRTGMYTYLLLEQ